MGANNRDDFRKKTKFQIAMRVGWLCSYPSCRDPTVGATLPIRLSPTPTICSVAPIFLSKARCRPRSGDISGDASGTRTIVAAFRRHFSVVEILIIESDLAKRHVA